MAGEHVKERVMAGFCKTCNAPAPAGSGFCPSCGSAVETAAAAPGYVAAPPKKSGSTLKIVLIVIAVVVVLGVAGVAILGYAGYRALHTAGNSFSMGKGADVSDADLGVSIYPGAVRNADGGMRMNLANNLVVSAMFTTSDSATDVVSYYQGKLGAGATSMQIGRVTSLTLATATGGGRDSVTVTVTPQTSGATQIMIQHTKTQKP
jgi:hypothetical protein